MCRQRMACLLTSVLVFTLAAALLPTMEQAHAAHLNPHVRKRSRQLPVRIPRRLESAQANGLDCLLRASDGEATIAAKSMTGTSDVLDVLRSQTATIMSYGAVHGRINVTNEI